MKIAILSDIHGNIVALEEVIKDAKRNNINKYIVAGDIILDFPFINEVVDAVKDLNPYAIKGNREKYLEKYEEDSKNAKWNTMQLRTIKDNVEMLTKENKEFIKNLPEQLSLNIEGLKIKVVHGSPYKISGFVDFENKQELDKITSELEEDILVVGHTHDIAKYIKHNGKIIINDGTVGMHMFTDFAQYVILEYVDGKVDIQTRTVEYDKEKLKELIKESPIYEDSRAWINLCYCDIVGNSHIRGQFTNEGIEMMHKKHNIKEENKSMHVRYSKFNTIDDDIYKELIKKYEKYFLIK